jgi:murein DD-endopeptidase MepM/ murein hydrolase activator NlpD
MEKLLFPTLTGTWKSDVCLAKYAQVVFSDVRDRNPFLDPYIWGEWVRLLHKTWDVNFSWGGYMENREEILEGTYLQSGRRIHLGVDYWVGEGYWVCLPKKGELVYAKQHDDQNGGWGGQVIFKIDGLYYIFGHLDNIVVKIGKVFPAGSQIGTIAGVGKSGGWWPHLHVQCMRKFDIDVDGYGSKEDPFRWTDYPNPTEAINVVG